ncbi:MAG: hypothetical protein JSW55_03660 [Chloroflexota bacterium]|nr:MAG: hypothetical protein JSW55_03660 [Chloroflexota bacterium]
MDFPGKELIKEPMLELRYDIEIEAAPGDIWPWIQQFGYHRGGWYIDTWWDKFAQKYFWPAVVPKDARGTYKPAANEILQEYQSIKKGDIVPDGPPGSAYYEVVEVESDRLLLLFATSHFKYVAPQFLYKTRFAPNGAFCWAFIIDEIDKDRSRLISWWRSEGYPKTGFVLIRPFLALVDGVHQKEILKGIKKRVETSRKSDIY